jgi:hypothetical protein
VKGVFDTLDHAAIGLGAGVSCGLRWRAGGPRLGAMAPMNVINWLHFGQRGVRQAHDDTG